MGQAAAKRAAVRQGVQQRRAVVQAVTRGDASDRAEVVRGEVVGHGLAAEVRELVEVGQQRRELLLREVELVEGIRARGGSWRLLGDVLGVTPQAVQQRYGERLGGLR